MNTSTFVNTCSIIRKIFEDSERTFFAVSHSELVLFSIRSLHNKLWEIGHSLMLKNDVISDTMRLCTLSTQALADCLFMMVSSEQNENIEKFDFDELLRKQYIWSMEAKKQERREKKKERKKNRQREKYKKKKNHSNNIIDIFYKKRNKQFIDSLNIIAMSILLYWSTHKFLNIEIQTEVMFFLCTCGFLVCIAKFLLSFRIKNDYYGTNYEEAKELLYYLKNDNNNNCNLGKKIFNDDKEQNKLSIGEKPPGTNEF